MRKLRYTPLYKPVSVPKRYGKKKAVALEILDGNFEKTRFTIHSADFVNDRIQFQYDLLKHPMPFNKRKFERIVKNIVYNALISAINK